MKQALWGAVAFAGWLAFIAIGLCITTPSDQRDVAVVDAVVAVIAGVGAVVGAVLLSQWRAAEPGPESGPVRDAVRVLPPEVAAEQTAP